MPTVFPYPMFCPWRLKMSSNLPNKAKGFSLSMAACRWTWKQHFADWISCVSERLVPHNPLTSVQVTHRNISYPNVVLCQHLMCLSIPGEPIFGYHICYNMPLPFKMSQPPSNVIVGYIYASTLPVRQIVCDEGPMSWPPLKPFRGTSRNQLPKDIDKRIVVIVRPKMSCAAYQFICS